MQGCVTTIGTGAAKGGTAAAAVAARWAFTTATASGHSVNAH